MNIILSENTLAYLAVWGIPAVTILIVMLLIGSLPEVDAFTLEEIEELQAEQRELNEELKEIKGKLEQNQTDINETSKLREDIRSEITVLKLAEADDSVIFAREIILNQETLNLRELKLERIDLLEEQSTKKQRVNSINDDVRYNVVGVDESEVELVSSDNINLQINIDNMIEQLEIFDQMDKSIDEEITANKEQIEQYGKTRDKYQREYLATEEKADTDWSALANLSGAKRLADSLNEIIDVLEEQETYLKDEKKKIANKQQTIINIIEVSKAKLLQNEINNSEKRKLVGVKLSETCIKMIRNNFTTTCPTYDDLINIDSSIQYVSGYFVTEDDGFFHRAEPVFQNSWRWYDNDEEIRIILDPPKGMAERIAMITIENNFGVYFRQSDMQIDDELNMKYNKHRYIDRCFTATLSSDVWGTALTDTINMLQTGCKKTTIQETFIDPLPKTEIDITTSPYWQYTQWLDESKNTCKTICKQY